MSDANLTSHTHAEEAIKVHTSIESGPAVNTPIDFDNERKPQTRFQTRTRTFSLHICDRALNIRLRVELQTTRDSSEAPENPTKAVL